VGDLAVEAEVAGGTVEVAGDDVPGHATLGQVVQGAEAAGHGVGLFVGRRYRHPEPELLGRGGHRRDLKERVVHRYLHRAPYRGVARSLVGVVDAEHVGDE